MINKLFLKYDDQLKDYLTIDLGRDNGQSGLLYMLYMSLNPLHDWIVTNSQGDNVQIQINFFDEDTSDVNENGILNISQVDYRNIIKTWNQNIQYPALYLVFTQSDTGHIALEAKSKLSTVDLEIMNNDKNNS